MRLLFSLTLITLSLCGIFVEKSFRANSTDFAARVFNGANYEIRSMDILGSQGWKVLHKRRVFTKSTLMYIIFHQLNNAEIDIPVRNH